jgi:hypothetical protein
MPSVGREQEREVARRLLGWLALAIGVAVVAVGCGPTYAPPVRSDHYGAPEDMQPGSMDLGVAAGTTIAGSARYSVRRWASVEAGLGAIRSPWMILFVGPRFTGRVPLTPTGFVFANGDVEAGAGVGVGGELCGNSDEHGCNADDLEWDGREWWERTAGGAYLGGGGALRIGHRRTFAVAVYGRTRLQVSGADGIPVTMWWTAVVGLQITILGHLRLYGGGGYVTYLNEAEREERPLLDVGLRILVGPGPRG